MKQTNGDERTSKTRFPTIETMNRRAAEKTDVRKKLRYFDDDLLAVQGTRGSSGPLKVLDLAQHFGEVDPAHQDRQIGSVPAR